MTTQHAGRWALGLLLLACAGGDPVPVAQSLPATAPRERVEAAQRGAEWFAGACASCHGASARGDGPRAASMHPPPADLTQLAARRGGAFDFDVIASYIDGRRPLESHGPSQMPVWGGERDDPEAPLSTEENRLSPVAIHQIVEYLKTLQRAGPAGP